jgi:hypothetical protein
LQPQHLHKQPRRHNDQQVGAGFVTQL